MTYSRDGRSPAPSSARVSATMSRIRSKDTAPEMHLRRMLRAAGHTGYRLHYAQVPGRADVAFVAAKVAAFVHGCFWHGCLWCNPQKPRHNARFWVDKITANQRRDARKSAALRKAGWAVITIRECQLRQRPNSQLDRVVRTLQQRR